MVTTSIQLERQRRRNIKKTVGKTASIQFERQNARKNWKSLRVHEWRPPHGLSPPRTCTMGEPRPLQAPSADEGITGLVRSCSEGTPRSCIGAAHTLGQCGGLSIESRVAIRHAGGVIALVRLASSSFPDVQAHVVSALLSTGT